MAHGVILFAHGARAASWALPFEKLRERVATMHPGAHVRLAFLELMQPDLGSVVDDLTNESVERIDLFPIFLAVGSHLREDLPQLVSAAQARHPGLHITVHPALGESEAMLAAIAGGIGQALAAS